MKNKSIIFGIICLVSFFSCSKEPLPSDIIIPENSVSCKIDGIEFNSSGYLLLCGAGCIGFSLTAESIVDPRTLQIVLGFGANGKVNVGPKSPNPEIFFSRYLPFGLSYYDVVYESLKSDNNDQNIVNIIKNDGRNAIGIFNLTLSDGNKKVRVSEGKFNIYYRN
ncbi:MAG: hypothetical protein IPK88_04210 [Saprospiraceae bacterium]|nr:hypothetical protein [Candidatus Defluviibacterium haderslevense]